MNDFLPVPFPWIDNAKCAGMDQSIFFPEVGTNNVQAKRICKDCPALEPCRTWGVNHEKYGWWGGLSPQERRKLRAGGRTVACHVCGTEFVTRANGTRFMCSDECRADARRRTVKASHQRSA